METFKLKYCVCVKSRIEDGGRFETIKARTLQNQTQACSCMHEMEDSVAENLKAGNIEGLDLLSIVYRVLESGETGELGIEEQYRREWRYERETS